MSALDLSVYLVTQSEQLLKDASLESVVAEAIKGGVSVVQLREKTCDTRAFVDRARSIKRVCDASGVPLIINDRVDVALAVGAAGVHLGQDDMRIEEARQLLPRSAVIGVSAGSIQEAIQAAEEGADYIGVGACWATGSKDVDENKVLGPRGIKRIAEALLLKHLEVPVVIIGGINVNNVWRSLYGCAACVTHANGVYEERHVQGVAVISAIMASPDPGQVASRLRAAVIESKADPVLHFREDGHDVLDRIPVLLSSLAAPSSGGVIHHITNTVVQNDCANLTLALRSSPIMSASPEEAEELAQLMPGCLVLNLGTLNGSQIEAMNIAGQAANRLGKPIICDPVAVGASELRRRETFRLLNSVQMTIIKGNMGEIATIAGAAGASSRGVDSSGALADPARVVLDLARRERCIVVMTGATDYISDGVRLFKCDNGHAMLGHITGSGCMTGSSMACFAAVSQKIGGHAATNLLAAAIAGITTINVAAELAMRTGQVNGPNTFRSALIDAMYRLDDTTLQKHARITEIAV